jgi:hypothetical protein
VDWQYNEIGQLERVVTDGIVTKTVQRFDDGSVLVASRDPSQGEDGAWTYGFSNVEVKGWSTWAPSTAIEIPGDGGESEDDTSDTGSGGADGSGTSPWDTTTIRDRVVTGNDIGSVFGSTIGQTLAGKNVFAQVAAGSALSAVLGNVGQTFDAYFGIGQTAAPSFDAAVDAAFGNFSVDLAGAFQNAAVGAVSSFLTGELAEAIGFDGTGFGDQLLRSSVGSLTSTVLNNAVVLATHTAAQAAQLGVTSVFSNVIGNAEVGIGSFIGRYLASEIVAVETVGGAIGQSLGASLGALAIGSVSSAIVTALGLQAISTLVAGIILPGIGALIGAVIGTLIGNLFASGNGAEWGATMEHELRPGDRYLKYTTHWGNMAAPVEQLSSVSEAASQAVNSVIDAVGGRVANTGTLQARYLIDNDGADRFNYTRISGGDAPTYSETGNIDGEFAVVEMVKRLEIAGGNVFMKRAMEATSATSMSQLSGELSIASDFARYIENKDVIDALIAQNPDSTFAAGWLITLLQAEQLGLNQWNKSDFYGGVAPFLKSWLPLLDVAADDVRVRIDGSAARARGFTPCNPDVELKARLRRDGRVPGPAISQRYLSHPANDNTPTDMVNRIAA